MEPLTVPGLEEIQLVRHHGPVVREVQLHLDQGVSVLPKHHDELGFSVFPFCTISVRKCEVGFTLWTCASVVTCFWMLSVTISLSISILKLLSST